MGSIKNNLDRILFYLLIILFLVFISPIFFRPILDDESIYFYHSWSLKNGHHFYDANWTDDKGPGVYILYALFSPFRDNMVNFYSVRTLTVVYQFFTVYVFFLISKKLFEHKNRFIPYIATLLYIYLYCSSLFEGQFSNADNFINLPILLAMYLFIKGNKWLPFLLIGLSFLIKQNTALQAIPFSLMIFFQDFKVSWKEILNRFKTLLLQILVFLIPTLVFSIFTIYWGTFSNFLNLAFLERIGSHLLVKNYEYGKFYFRPILFNTVPLWLAPIIGLFFLYKKTKELAVEQRKLTHLFLWLGVSLLSIWSGGYFFPHYFLEMVPAGVLLLTALVLSLKDDVFYPFFVISSFLSWYFLKFNLIFIILLGIIFWFIYTIGIYYSITKVTKILLTVALIVLTSFGSGYYKTFFTLWVSPTNLYSSYDRSALFVSYILKDLPSDKIFIFDYAPRIHYLSNKFPYTKFFSKTSYIDYTKVSGIIAGYPHGFDFSKRVEEVQNIFETDPPDYLVVSFSKINFDKELPELGFLKDILTKYVVYSCGDDVCIYNRALPGESTLKSNPYINTQLKNNKYLDIRRPNRYMEFKVELICQDYYASVPTEDNTKLLPVGIGKNQLVIELPNRKDLKDCRINFTNLMGNYTLDKVVW